MPRIFHPALLAAGALIAAATAAFASVQPPSDSGAPIEIILADFSFTPAALTLKADKPVTLRFTNRGSGGHDFTARAFFKAATMDAATRRGIAKGKIALDKGARREITLTPARGRYTVHCSHFLHSGFGMKGTIIVE